jgi:sporulation protein YlmC with PRC-barrel domain
MRRMLLALSGLMAMVLLGGADQELSKAEATGVLGRMVHDSSGQQVGRVVDVIVDPTGAARAIVVDTGGFMGVGARRVAVNWNFVHVPPPGSADDNVNIDLSDDQVKSAPEYTDRTKPATIVGLPTDPAAKP